MTDPAGIIRRRKIALAWAAAGAVLLTAAAAALTWWAWSAAGYRAVVAAGVGTAAAGALGLGGSLFVILPMLWGGPGAGFVAMAGLSLHAWPWRQAVKPAPFFVAFIGGWMIYLFPAGAGGWPGLPDVSWAVLGVILGHLFSGLYHAWRVFYGIRPAIEGPPSATAAGAGELPPIDKERPFKQN